MQNIISLAVAVLFFSFLSSCDNQNQPSFDKDLGATELNLKHGKNQSGIPKYVKNWRYKCTAHNDSQACIAFQNWMDAQNRYLEESPHRAYRNADSFRKLFDN